ncbi:enoyl-CoA hydratase [Salisediminibacterium beveridgei]|uniref:Enoyl-CoA hydratase n=1 Tax=Salisediminibacterium beveridgei TaxID=632773 RepID=A0A1D7QTF7_9BACI|nr:enoyl-CoA hydratase [Salisediminibacterium beveridgei]AOM82306.1 Enoyl-CoA hydratase [Salisediminibacterium beveridgei]
MSDTSLTSVRFENHVAIVTLSNPPANAISESMIAELDEVFKELGDNPEAKVILLQGEGKFFAAGADIKEFTEMTHANEFRETAREGQRVFRMIETLSKPVIAVIHGAALGGGLELAMACHMRLVTSSAKLGLPELNLGLIPGFAGTQRLPRIVGHAKALQMTLTSDPISGEEAVAFGLANQLVSEDDPLGEAMSIAGKMAAKPAKNLAAVLELIHEAERDSLERGQEKEAVLFGDLAETKNAAEGIRAFLEKRPPKFEDR